jgi:site-specific DNA-adenine methylase
MFSYYGSKENIVDHYPHPRHDMIIEPFAGSARYALKHWQKDVILVDRFKVIIDIWKYLQACTAAEIWDLPVIEAGKSVKDYRWDSQAQCDLMGFIIQYGSTHPGRMPGAKMDAGGRHYHRNHLNFTKGRIVENLHKIKHWDIRHGDFRDIPNQKATWFIDPPYVTGGQKYKYHKVDYGSLAKWSLQREGQIIVCENGKADWLPFKPFRENNGSKGKRQEVIYTNEPMYYQQNLFT